MTSSLLRRRVADVIGACILYAGLFMNAAAVGNCPPGTVEVRREKVGADTHVYCERIENLDPAQLATLDPAAVRGLSPVDRRHLRRRQATSRLPMIDSSLLVSPDWLAYARKQRDDLIARRISLMRLRDALTQEQLIWQGLAMENVQLTQELLYDDIGHTLTVVKELGKALAQAGGIPPTLADTLDRLATLAQADVHGLASARATDPLRKTDKIIDSATAIRNLFVEPMTGLSSDELKAVRRVTDALSKLAKSAQRLTRGEKLDAKAIANHADNVMDAASDLRLLRTLKAARSTFHMAGAEIALGFLEADRADMERMFFEKQSAKDACDARIARIDQFIAAYERHLGRTGS